MILLQNNIIKLDYDPATDIIEVNYPDLQGYLLPEIRNSINLMVETIRNYDVKKLLIDVSQTVVDVSDDENREISVQLAAELQHTRLQKMARVQPKDNALEAKAQENIKLIKAQGLLPYQIKTFTDKAVALIWLKENQ